MTIRRLVGLTHRWNNICKAHKVQAEIVEDALRLRVLEDVLQRRAEERAGGREQRALLRHHSSALLAHYVHRHAVGRRVADELAAASTLAARARRDLVKRVEQQQQRAHEPAGDLMMRLHRFRTSCTHCITYRYRDIYVSHSDEN